MTTRVLITGGAGFIGSAFVRRVLGEAVEEVVVLDALTYAGHRINLEGLEGPRLRFVHGDVCDERLVERLLTERAIDAIVHLAAETHVDRSIAAAHPFVRTNVEGTLTLLDAARRAWEGRYAATRFVHVSTDEVFGALGDTGRFDESSPYAPSSPYAASKAAADHLVRAYGKTHGLPVIVTASCNNFGPRQLPEKLVPLMIVAAAEGRALPVYGEGRQIREWLHVEDHSRALWLALTRGRPGETYLFGSGEELSNAVLVERIADLVDERLARAPGTARARIERVPDRKGHDYRYAVDAAKARRELGWSPEKTLADALPETVAWYLANPRWRETVMSGLQAVRR